jgi:hypothetical protein
MAPKRIALVAAIVLSVAALVPIAANRLGSSPGSEKESFVGDADYPPALARHLEALTNNGEEQGPSSAEMAKLISLAYPDTDIPLARLTTEKRDSDEVESRGTGGTNTWKSIGPSQAIYPLSEFRTLRSYVPNEYAAASRINAMALASTCVPGNCRLWIGPAGGGIWRTNDALADPPDWKYTSSSFAINSIGAITLDPTDSSGNTIWVGTGEANSCSSGCVHGVGLYKSTDGGDTWSGPIGGSAFSGRGVGSIAIDPRNPSVIYASSVLAVNGYTSVCCSGVTRITVPGAKIWGLYKSTDGGQNWTFIHNGSANAAECANATPSAVFSNSTPCSTRGVRIAVLDPSNPDVVYASSYARGVWRSPDAGTTWTQIKASLNATISSTLPWVAVTTLANGNTRMYISEGHVNDSGQYSRVFRSDSVRTGTPTWQDLTSSDPADPRWATFNFCGSQCWYDNFVTTPPGYPDLVYVGGSYAYRENYANHRAVVLSTDAGATWTDMTADSTDPVHPNALHPDQHYLLTNPGNPYQFFEANDGGVVRSSGQFADVSSWCDSRNLIDARDERCQQMLSRVPTKLTSLNLGLTTLQFQSVSVNPFNANDLQGGTQDNGTWQNNGSTVKWVNTMIGDGGQSGFDVADPHFRFHTFAGPIPDVNFSDGAYGDWNYIADPLLASKEGAEFYVPIISDPKVSKSLYIGAQHVWRTKTAGQGTMTMQEFRHQCNEWTGINTVTCGDWQPLGTKLTDPSFGNRAGGNVVAVVRAPSDTSTLWAATTTGRVFVSHNADAEPASAVTFTRVDTLSTSAPNRFISSIYIDPENPNHAWISYTGFSAATPATPGHVFDVTFNADSATATYSSLDRGLGDLPITALVRDDQTGSLYAATDYGVIRLNRDSDSWREAAIGMPKLEVPGLSIVVPARKLYAATHGQGVWLLDLAKGD